MNALITKSLFSEARFVVLRVVYLAADTGVSLREIAYRCELSIGAVQTALRSLLSMKMIIKEQKKRRTIITLNKCNSDYPLVIALLVASLKESFNKQAKLDSKNNQTLFSSLEQMHRLSRQLMKAVDGA